jgi:hypothetical protein
MRESEYDCSGGSGVEALERWAAEYRQHAYEIIGVNQFPRLNRAIRGGDSPASEARQFAASLGVFVPHQNPLELRTRSKKFCRAGACVGHQLYHFRNG